MANSVPWPVSVKQRNLYIKEQTTSHDSQLCQLLKITQRHDIARSYDAIDKAKLIDLANPIHDRPVPLFPAAQRAIRRGSW
jgi:hypothetical protein